MIVVDGCEVEPRPLTLPELRGLKGDTGEQECAAIALTCDMHIDTVNAWYNTAPAGHVLAVVKAVFAASGIGEDATKSDAAADDVRPSRAPE